MKKAQNIFLVVLLTIFIAGCSKSDDALHESGTETYSIIDGTIGTDGNGQPSTSGQPGIITAGEWSDLDNWEFWKGLMTDNTNYEHLERWQVFPKNRYIVSFDDFYDKPVVDAVVRLYATDHSIIWEAKTDNNGIAQLYTGLFGVTENASYIKLFFENQEFDLNPIVLFEQGYNNYILSAASTAPTNADIMFVVDATGSMGDEIEYLKTELSDVISRTANTYANINIRLSSVFYRDNNDQYLTRVTPFTTNISQVSNFVNQQSAGGGGDFEEAVEAGLSEALNQQWSTEARARILFLILDAPPHYTPQIVADIQNSIQIAAKYGIKIIPVAASGINKETEFLMRLMAIGTNGTYTFITDDSGVGNDHLEPTVGQYDVEYLNDLFVRLISENVSY